MTTNHNHQTKTRNYQPGTKVFSILDAEPGTILGVCTYRRNGIGAWTYLVETAYGKEVWDASDTFPQTDANQD